MPIYEYRCSSCGFENEYLQRVSDPLLTKCPECGKATFEKLMSATSFQLKGSGWYATDFKNGPAKPKADKDKPAEKAAETKTEEKSDKPVETKKEERSDKPVETKTEEKSDAGPARGSGASPATR